MLKRLLLFFLLIPVFLMASVQWQENGVPVKQGDHISNIHTLSLNDGSYVNIWNDCRDGELGIYAQKVNNDGDILWGETGIEIMKNDHMLYISDVIRTSDNSFVVCWRDVWDDAIHTDHHYLQKIDTNGNLLWDNPQVISYPDGYIRPKLISTDNGSVITIYYCSALHKLIALKYLANGTMAEGWDNVEVLSGCSSDFEISSDLTGGVIVVGKSCESDVYAQRLDDTGVKFWGINGILLHGYIDGYAVKKFNITAVNSNDYRITWSFNNEQDNNGLCMESFNGSGQPNWDDPAEILCDYIYYFAVNLLVDSSTMLTWQSSYDLVINKIDSEGNPLWENTIISQSQDYYMYFREENVITDNDNNTVLSWKGREDNINNIYIQKINQDGELLFSTQGIQIYQTESYDINYQLCCNNDTYYTTWICEEGSNLKIKQQILNYEGLLQLADQGKELHSGTYGQCRDMVMLKNGDHPILLWKDHRNIDTDQIYIQILNSDGTPQFTEDGIPITTLPEIEQRSVSAALGENSGVIAAIWENISESYTGAFVQGVDSSGNFLWSDSTGVELGSPNISTQYPKIDCYDNNGIDEFYAGWSNLNTTWNFDIHAQKIVDGVPQWDEPVVIAEDEYVDCILLDVKNRFYLWKSGLWNQPDLHLKLLNEDGSVAENWPEEGLQIADELYSYYYGNDTTKMSLLDEGVFISWVNHDNSNITIYGQIIDFEGNALWDEGGKQLHSGLSVEQSSHLVIGDNIYITWVDYSEIVQYLQKINLNGETVWENNLQITPENDISGSAVLSAVDNNVLVVWEYSENYDNSMLKAQMISPEGELAYALDGIMVADGFKRQQKQQVYSFGNNVYVSWIDGRSTFFSEGLSSYDNIYAQKLLLNPTYNPNDVVDSGIQQLSNHPNPFNPVTTINYNLASDTEVELSIYNIKGQKIKNLVQDKQKMGQHSVIWKGVDDNKKSVSSGIYLYKLKTETGKTTKRMLLLK